MSQIDKEVLKKLEKLSSLEIEESKKDETIKEIVKIVDFVENLNELDLSDKDPSFYIEEGGTPFREDTPTKSDVIETILKNAPNSKEGFFIVPKIVG
jgi:aspartyl-tRNA(Asn)/glutamyl-tRNA(Gln) amidotransferase subunit C